MQTVSEQERVFAAAIYEIRQLLSGYLGSENEDDLIVSQVAHLAYALHNQAEQSLAGEKFNLERACSAVSRVDEMLGSTFISQFERHGVTWRT
jgi:hypothetical protein